MSPDVHLHFHGERSSRVMEKLDSILTRVIALDAQAGRLLMAYKEVIDILTRMDVATDNIAADVKLLTEAVKPGMTEEEVAEVKSIGLAIAEKLEGLAASTEDPIPAA